MTAQDRKGETDVSRGARPSGPPPRTCETVRLAARHCFPVTDPHSPAGLHGPHRQREHNRPKPALGNQRSGFPPPWTLRQRKFLFYRLSQYFIKRSFKQSNFPSEYNLWSESLCVLSPDQLTALIKRQGHPQTLYRNSKQKCTPLLNIFPIRPSGWLVKSEANN